MSTPKLPALLDLDGMTQLFGKSPRTIYRWRQIGYGPASVKVGNKLFWTRESVIDWVASLSGKTNEQ